MHRRSHKKSRHGCFECKRRHMKCDESRPQCVNCKTSDRACTYPEVEGARASAASRSPVAGPSSSSPAAQLAPFLPNATIPDVPLFPPRPDDETTVNMAHMELLHHYHTDGFRIIFTDEDASMRKAAVKYALQTPCLMYQLLSLSARHLGVKLPEQATYYHGMAIRLQTQALTLFHGTRVELVGDTGQRVALVLFSSLLGTHALCDTLSFRDDDFSMTLARFIGYMRLHRGVQKVLSGHAEGLHESDLKPVTTQRLAWYQAVGVGHECDDIRRRIDDLASTMGTETHDACKKAINHLQWAFDGRRPDVSDRGHIAITWPVMIDYPFAMLLEKANPEALVILGYYFLLLHFFKDFWVINGPIGEYLLESLARYLGPAWATWLETPFRLLRESGTAVGQSVGVCRASPTNS